MFPAGTLERSTFKATFPRFEQNRRCWTIFNRKIAGSAERLPAQPKDVQRRIDLSANILFRRARFARLPQHGVSDQSSLHRRMPSFGHYSPVRHAFVVREIRILPG